MLLRPPASPRVSTSNRKDGVANVRKTGIALIAVAIHVGPALAADLTPEEVISRVRDAAAQLAKEGEAGLATFNSPDSPYIGGGSYVFVFDCAKNLIVGHPVKTSQGLPISTLIASDGDHFGDDMCEAAKKPNGAWSQYMWEKPVEASDGSLDYTEEPYRKVSFMMSVPGQPYQVGAGIYLEGPTLAELDALAEK
jgi:signal transduction histidine kinase